jgi:hypothetical protein
MILMIYWEIANIVLNHENKKTEILVTMNM